MFPSSDVPTTNADSPLDVPATFRSDVLDLMTQFNLLRNHIHSYMQGLLTSPSASVARSTLGAAASGENTDITSITGNAATASNALGVGQVWTTLAINVTRYVNTTYTNDTGRTIVVAITFQPIGSANLTVDSDAVASYYYSSVPATQMTLTAIVPPGNTYGLNTSSTLIRWKELR